ncbi:MAG: MarR family transcriptional regulator, partial [Sulfurovum sp.]|nr:MarR family transcriptional regulator [Sulfurovum sp.]
RCHKSTIEYEGYVWVYNTIEQLREQFRFFSADTIKRTLKKLKDAGFVRVERLSKDKRDRTNYYAIDYKKLESLEDAHCIGAKCTDGEGQNAPMSEGKMHRCINDKSFDRDYTEITTETTTPLNSPPAKNTKKRGGATVEDAAVFADSADFAFRLNPTAYKEWLEYRRKKRKPVSLMAMQKQVALLCRYDEATQKEIVDRSIANDYQGLFEPKSESGSAAGGDDSIDWFKEFGYE